MSVALVTKKKKFLGIDHRWVSEFLRYILRAQPETSKMLEAAEKSLNFENPIVGVHVRRTDKVGTEAAFHGVEEYMKYVRKLFFIIYRLKTV